METNPLFIHHKSGRFTNESSRFNPCLIKHGKTALWLFMTISLTLFLEPTKSQAQTLIETDNYKFGVSGYLRSGIGESEGKKTQAHFQMPGALNKFSLGNQADTYGELEFDYTHFLNKDKTKSLDAVWMVSIYEDFGTEHQMTFNKTEQLYLRANNLLGAGEVIWAGKRFYDRSAIHMLDRQWINPGQAGPGFGIESLLKKGTKEDIKLAVWRFEDEDVISYKNKKQDKLNNYTFDARWVHMPLNENMKLNLALNYSYRLENKDLGYDAKHGFGAFSWLDFERKHISNTTAILFRQGSNVSIHHWTGISEKENPANDNVILNDINSSYSLEINNNFLYDDKERFAINGILLGVVRDYGTKPHLYLPTSITTSSLETNLATPQVNITDGSMLYWLAVGGRAMYYICDQFRLSLELTHEYVDNQQRELSGNLSKITFSPEFSLKKGFYARPVLRPLITYAKWSDSLQGNIGTTPKDAPFADKTSGFTYGLQFEIWW